MKRWWLVLLTIPGAMVLLHGCGCGAANSFEMPNDVESLVLEEEGACEQVSLDCYGPTNKMPRQCFVEAKGSCHLDVIYKDGALDRLAVTYTEAEGCDPCIASSLGDDAIVKAAGARAQDAGARDAATD